jgi:hypothetical protein
MARRAPAGGEPDGRAGPHPLLRRNKPRAEFVRRRLADAIERGDDQAAARLRALLDAMLNGPRR